MFIHHGNIVEWDHIRSHSILIVDVLSNHSRSTVTRCTKQSRTSIDIQDLTSNLHTAWHYRNRKAYHSWSWFVKILCRIDRHNQAIRYIKMLRWLKILITTMFWRLTVIALSRSYRDWVWKNPRAWPNSWAAVPTYKSIDNRKRRESTDSQPDPNESSWTPRIIPMYE